MSVEGVQFGPFTTAHLSARDQRLYPDGPEAYEDGLNEAAQAQ